MRRYIENLISSVGIDDRGKEALLFSYDALVKEGSERILTDITESFLTGKGSILTAIDQLSPYAEQAGVHRYTLNLLFCLAASRGLEPLWEKAGYTKEMLDDANADFLCKYQECMTIHKIPGTFVPEWYHGHFRLERVSLGRLQFHLVPARASYEKNGLRLREGETTVINMHIPSSGPLTEEGRLDSYRRAYAFYKERRGDLFTADVLPLVCHSWLLYPGNLNFFPEGSNILSFYHDFDIVKWEDGPNFDKDAERIFGRVYTGDPSNLPRSTRLQRGLADYLASGRHMGCGYGIIAHNGTEILR